MKKIILLLSLITFMTNVSAQGTWKKFDSSNSGLLYDSIFSFGFDSKNNLWGIYGLWNTYGVVKFDGTTWTQYNTANSGLPSDDVKEIAFDSNGNIWFACHNVGLAKFDGTQWTVIDVPGARLDVVDIVFDSKGNLWLADYTTGIWKYDGSSWKTYTRFNSPLGDDTCVSTIFIDDKDRLWVGMDCGGVLAMLDPQTEVWTTYKDALSHLRAPVVKSIMQDSTGKMWFGVHYDISSFDGTSWVHYPMPIGLGTSQDPAPTASQSLIEDYEGNLWCGSAGRGLVRFDGTNWVPETVPGSLNDLSIARQSVNIDKKGNLWWGEMSEGLWKREDPSVVSIPDPNFRNCLKHDYPFLFNANNKLILAEAPRITSISCSSVNIEEVEGLQYFKNLQYLDVRDNSIKSIPDITQSVLLEFFAVATNAIKELPSLTTFTNLKVLDVQQNQIQTLPALSSNVLLQILYVSENQLTELPDLSRNSQLKFLQADRNQLSIVGSEIPQLSKLEKIGYSHNNISELPDLSLNQNLTEVSIAFNSLTRIPDFSKCAQLEQLHCGNNLLTSLPDLSKNSKLIWLTCNDNQISQLPDLSKCSKLAQLDCSSNKLIAMPDLTQNSELVALHVHHNDLSNLPDLRLNPKLYIVTISNNNLTFEDILPLSNSPLAYFEYWPQAKIYEQKAVTLGTASTFSIPLGIDNGVTSNVYRWYKDNNLIETTSVNSYKIPSVVAEDAGVYRVEIVNTSLPQLVLYSYDVTLQVFDSPTADLEDLEFKKCLRETHPEIFDGNDMIILAEAGKITYINCTNKSIKSVNGVQIFTGLKEFFIDYNEIEQFPSLSTLSELESITCSSNQLKKLPDFSANTKLIVVIAGANQLTNFPDLANNKLIKHIDVQSNAISAVPSLVDFAELEGLILSNNPISTNLDLRINSKLRNLSIDQTEIPLVPDLRQNTELENLNFGRNLRIESFPDLSQNIKLASLRFDETSVRSVPDLSHLQLLVDVSCAGNELTALPDLSKNTALTHLNCSDNKLTTLPDLSKNAQLKHLICHSNELVHLPNLSKALELQTLNAHTNYLLDVPDLSGTKIGHLPESYLDVSDNQLSFQYLIPLVTLKTYQFIKYVPQHLPEQSLNFALKEKADLLIDIMIDPQVTSSRYDWYRDNNFVSSTSENILSISKVGLDDAGLYTCLITNSLVPGLELEWKSATVAVTHGNPGNPKHADHVFTPNNDGVDDFLYISNNGLTSIYDKSGVLVKQLFTPEEWDGSDSSGSPMPMGVYIVRTDGYKDRMVTLIR